MSHFCWSVLFHTLWRGAAETTGGAASFGIRMVFTGVSSCFQQRYDSGEIRFSEPFFSYMWNGVLFVELLVWGDMCWLMKWVGVKWSLIVGSNWISLMGKDVEHLLCLVTICIYLEKCLISFFVCFFLVGLFVFLLLRCKCSLCILNTDSSDTWFANIFSLPVDCLLIFLMVSFKAQKVWNFDESTLAVLFFLACTFLKKNLFLAALGLRCCARAFSRCGARGLLFVVVCRLLTAVASVVAEHGL